MIVLDEKEADTPPGKPVAAPIPVAPVVAWVILVKGVFMHKVGVEEAAPTVLFANTVRGIFRVEALLASTAQPHAEFLAIKCDPTVLVTIAGKVDPDEAVTE